MGSSPLTRGKPRTGATLDGIGGLIPAHAGKTRRGRGTACWRRAHPRSRGENSSDATPAKDSVGSSPLTRGKRGAEARPPGGHRLIPAHAGKTKVEGLVGVADLGSSPLTRGKRWHGASDRLGRGLIPAQRGKPRRDEAPSNRSGLIPAHAGKTSARGWPRCACAAHPRSRGENVAYARTQLRRRGSSPLTRGKPYRGRCGPSRGGLIPAHAGKTPSRRSCRALPGAHPRSRGENHFSNLSVGCWLGSSPLTRGKHDAANLADRLNRLIPAHAGKTLWRHRVVGDIGAHPRSRGENHPFHEPGG